MRDIDAKHVEVLVINDDHAIAESIREILVADDWSVWMGSTQEEVKAHLSQAECPSIVITPSHGSDLDGFLLIRRLASTKARFASIVIVSEFNMNLAMNAIEHGVSAMVPYPVSPSFLRAKVNEAAAALTRGFSPSEAEIPAEQDFQRALASTAKAAQVSGGNILPLNVFASEVAKQACDRLIEQLGARPGEETCFKNVPLPANVIVGPSSKREGAPQQDIEDVSRFFLKIIRMRAKHFPESLFGDPCWEMLLDLGLSHIQDKPVSVSSLCIASGIPQTTALRRISDLEKVGLVTRVKAPDDGRRIYVELTQAGMTRLFDFLKEFASANAGGNLSSRFSGSQGRYDRTRREATH